jgi:hypothetical protein
MCAAKGTARRRVCRSAFSPPMSRRWDQQRALRRGGRRDRPSVLAHHAAEIRVNCTNYVMEFCLAGPGLSRWARWLASPDTLTEWRVTRNWGSPKRGIGIAGHGHWIAWAWRRFQSDSALSQWYERRLGRWCSIADRHCGPLQAAGALWRLKTGVLPEGAVLKVETPGP